MTTEVHEIGEEDNKLSRKIASLFLSAMFVIFVLGTICFCVCWVYNEGRYAGIDDMRECVKEWKENYECCLEGHLCIPAIEIQAVQCENGTVLIGTDKCD